MLKIVDYGYADTNENLPKINIEEWKLSRASRIDYSVRGGYGVFESSNGKKIGEFEIAQSKTYIVVNYNDRQFVDIQDQVNRLGWLISNRGMFRSDAMLTMLASEKVLQKDWDSPEEDDAWANL